MRVDLRIIADRGDGEGWIFLSHPHTNNRFFFLLTTVDPQERSTWRSGPGVIKLFS